jgi:hypothetical protein
VNLISGFTGQFHALFDSNDVYKQLVSQTAKVVTRSRGISAAMIPSNVSHNSIINSRLHRHSPEIQHHIVTPVLNTSIIQSLLRSSRYECGCHSGICNNIFRRESTQIMSSQSVTDPKSSTALGKKMYVC